MFRDAKIEDSKLILTFINKLAVYEKLEHTVRNTEDLIKHWLFKENKANVFFIMENGIEIGFVLYFYNYSTFVGKPGIYVEDIFIQEEHRNKGYGKQVFKYLANKAKEEGLGRIEWVCLNWNTPSINFYKKMGANSMDDWIIFRLTENDITEL